MMNDLYHHGIQGMKWGVRRYQNEDGSLTSAGEARYYGKKEHNDSFGRKLLTGNTRIGSRVLRKGGKKASREWRANRLEKKANEAAKSGDTNKAEELSKKAEAQKAANANREAYDRHTSTGKMVAQNLLMSGFGAESYRNARARGESRGRAYVEAWASMTIVGKALERRGEKKAYGAAVWSDRSGDVIE